jgi:hypothetical protein
LIAIEIIRKVVIFQMDAGMEPERVLFARLREVKALKFPIDEGIDPENMLASRRR